MTETTYGLPMSMDDLRKRVGQLDSTSAVQKAADTYAGITLEGHVISGEDGKILLAGADQEIWEIPQDSILAANTAKPSAPYLGGVPVSLRVAHETRVRVIRVLEIGRDVIQCQGGVDDVEASGCGKEPKGCNGTCCKKGWCCHPYTKCCNSACCRP